MDLPSLYFVKCVIAEAGDHESLLAQNGVYRELYETQFRTILEMEGKTK